MIPEVTYDTISNFCIYAGYYVAIPFMAVWLVWPGLAPDEPDGWSFPDVATNRFVGNATFSSRTPVLVRSIFLLVILNHLTT